jgi:hypothetical protein
VDFFLLALPDEPYSPSCAPINVTLILALKPRAHPPPDPVAQWTGVAIVVV